MASEGKVHPLVTSLTHCILLVVHDPLMVVSLENVFMLDLAMIYYYNAVVINIEKKKKIIRRTCLQMIVKL